MPWKKTLWLGFLVPALAISSAFAQTTTKAAATGKGARTAVAASASASAGTSSATPAAGGGVAVAPPAASAAPAGSSVAPVPGPAGAAKAAPSPGGVDGATYSVRLRDLEQRIDELKEQIRRSHTRLSLLTDTIVSGGVGGSRAEIQFKNELSNAFKLTRALFVLDGAVQYNKSDDTGALAEQQQIPIFSGAIPPGDHTLQVVLQLQGNGYGVFSYLKGYHFDVRSVHSFTAVEGKTLALQVIGYEKGGVTTPLEERPAVRYDQKVTAGIAPIMGKSEPGGAAAPAPAPAPASGAGVKASTSISTGASLGGGGK